MAAEATFALQGVAHNICRLILSLSVLHAVNRSSVERCWILIETVLTTKHHVTQT
jgi:hypothetical protein